MQRDDDSDRYEYEHDRPLIEFMEAVDTVAHFVGGPTGEDLRRLLLDLAHLPRPVPPEQTRIEFDDSNALPF